MNSNIYVLQKERNAQFSAFGGRGVILNNLAQWHLLYLSTALAIWRIIRLSQGAPAFQDRRERRRKFNVSSPATSLKATAHRFSPTGYPGGIDAAFFPKTNTFSDHRKEVIPWRYFALRKPETTR